MAAASCVKCRLANIHGALTCAECELDKRFAPGCIDLPLPIEVTAEGSDHAFPVTVRVLDSQWADDYRERQAERVEPASDGEANGRGMQLSEA